MPCSWIRQLFTNIRGPAFKSIRQPAIFTGDVVTANDTSFKVTTRLVKAQSGKSLKVLRLTVFESVFCRPTSKLTWMNYRTAELFLLAFLTLSLLAVLALATLCATSSPNFIQRVRRPRSGISDQLLAHHSGHGKPSEAPKKNIAYGLDLWNGTTTPYILNKAEREEQLLKLLLKVEEVITHPSIHSPGRETKETKDSFPIPLICSSAVLLLLLSLLGDMV
ncbi:Glycerol-3-phosphate dehydrogenase [Trichinella pseudospiralis]